MSMYTHVQSRQRALAEQAAFQSHVHVHPDDLAGAVLRLVMHQIIIATAATDVAVAYMRVAVAVGEVLSHAA